VRLTRVRPSTPSCWLADGVEVGRGFRMLLMKLMARYMGSVVVAGGEEGEDGDERGLYMKAGILVVVANCVAGAGVVGRGL
jgi:hypothetical protein